MNEISVPDSGLGIWAAANGGGGGGFVGPRRVAVRSPAPAPVAPPTVYVRPPVVRVPITQIPGAVGIPGDIRPITARIIPGEAIETDTANMVDEMEAEIGIPGVDQGGGFPYGDPTSAGKPGTKVAPGNQALILAAIAAALLLGG